MAKNLEFLKKLLYKPSGATGLFEMVDSTAITPSLFGVAPTPGATYRGLHYRTEGAAGAADAELAVVKNSLDTYITGRVPIVGNDIIVLTNKANFTGTDVNTAQPIFEAANDVITLEADSSWIVDGAFYISTTGTSAHTIGLLWGGTATFTSIGGVYTASNAATNVSSAALSFNFASASTVVVGASLSSASHNYCTVNGIMRINAAGTVIPQFIYSAAAGVAPVVAANAYLRLMRFGGKAAQGAGPTA